MTASFGIKSPIMPTPTPTRPEKPRVDVSSVKVGSTVHHNTFGEGRVTELKGIYITVKFKQGEKRFMFPDAFEGSYLKI